MGKYTFLGIIVLILLTLTLGCGMHSPRKVAKSVKGSIQRTFDTEPQYANLHPVLKDLQLEFIDTSHYKGIAKVDVKGKIYNCEIKVNIEGQVANWEPVEGEFEFMFAPVP
jgi:hypothetical protein